MMTLRMFASKPPAVPMSAIWHLADLAEAKGKQELYTRQSPQMLKALREHAMIESAVSSNRIEGVNIDPARARAVIFGKTALRDRDEEEVSGYRDALKLIHESSPPLPINEESILQLHRLSRGQIRDAGQYKEKDVDIIETFPGGGSRVRFKTLPARQTPAAMQELILMWNDMADQRTIHPLVALGAFNLDFLCIHPFRDGNGRVSRLLLLLGCYHLGLEVGRYISLERLIEQNKDRYYETLQESSRDWHAGKHNPWPYINYTLFILQSAYREFQDRVGEVKSPRGSKTEVVMSAIGRAGSPFRVADIQRLCPGVSVDWIRQILKDLRSDGKVECLGRGQHAQWRRRGDWN